MAEMVPYMLPDSPAAKARHMKPGECKTPQPCVWASVCAQEVTSTHSCPCSMFLISTALLPCSMSYCRLRVERTSLQPGVVKQVLF